MPAEIQRERERERERESEINRDLVEFFIILRKIGDFPVSSFSDHSKVTGIDRIGKMGFVVSTSNAVAIQSLAASTSPSDSNTIPRLYLKKKANYINFTYRYVNLNFNIK